MISLGYTTYCAQAGDWGMFVARALGSHHPQHCKAVHLNFCPTPLPEGITLTSREEAVEARCADWLDNHLGYAVCMRSRPHTLGTSLTDNPLGHLVWIGEKYLELCSPTSLANPSFSAAWDDAILTTVSLYFLSNCIMTSQLPYFENVKHAGFGDFVLKQENYIGVPMGYTSYMYDSRPGTKRGVERSGRLVYYREVDEGGHFAALECPEGFVEDARAFFGEWFGKA
jgi:pimeloyl-ACP methyl ester carboxylesterase